MSQDRDQDDFLGWAPAEPLSWEPETTSERPAPELGKVSPPPAETASPLTSEEWSAPARRQRQPQAPTPVPGRQVARAPQAAAPARQNTPGRPRKAAAPMFVPFAVAFAVLLLFTLATLLRVVGGGSGLGPVPVVTAVATLMLGRAAWAMRPR